MPCHNQECLIPKSIFTFLDCSSEGTMSLIVSYSENQQLRAQLRFADIQAFTESFCSPRLPWVCHGEPSSVSLFGATGETWEKSIRHELVMVNTGQFGIALWTMVHQCTILDCTASVTIRDCDVTNWKGKYWTILDCPKNMVHQRYNSWLYLKCHNSWLQRQQFMIVMIGDFSNHSLTLTSKLWVRKLLFNYINQLSDFCIQRFLHTSINRVRKAGWWVRKFESQAPTVHAWE